MNGRSSMETSALIKRLENDLAIDFPGWIISREESGRWAATRHGWGVLYGQSAAELRNRLGRYSSQGDVR